jgi:hypothetical protein
MSVSRHVCPPYSVSYDISIIYDSDSEYQTKKGAPTMRCTIAGTPTEEEESNYWRKQFVHFIAGTSE